MGSLFHPLLLLYAFTAAAPLAVLAVVCLWVAGKRRIAHAVTAGGLGGGVFVLLLGFVVAHVTSSPVHGQAAAWLGFFLAGVGLFSIVTFAGLAVAHVCCPSVTVKAAQ